MIKRLRKIFPVGICFGLMSIGTVAFAAIENVGGGSWQYYIQDYNVHSEYYHDSSAHGASTGYIKDGKNVVLSVSVLKAPGEVAEAHSSTHTFYADAAWWSAN